MAHVVLHHQRAGNSTAACRSAQLRCIEDMYLPGKEIDAMAEHLMLQNMPSAQPFYLEGR